MGKIQPDVNIFWINYRDIVLKFNVSESDADLYVKWATNFALSIKGKPLKERKLEDVKAYLTNLREQRDINEIQVEQARKALYLLYYKFLNVPLDFSGHDNTAHQAKFQNNENNVKAEKNDFLLKKEIRKSQEKLIEKIQKEMRYKHYSIKTEYTYIDWVLRYLSFFNGVSPEGLGFKDIKQYLDYLAVERKVSSSTQNQALNAIVFMYTQVLNMDPGDFSDFTRAKTKRNIPVVLTVDEVNRVLDNLEGDMRLMACLLYGAGLRIMECVRLRIKDVDFSQNLIVVRNGKGNKDRITMLPGKCKDQLKEKVDSSKKIFLEDITSGSDGVYIWPAYDRKDSGAKKDWIWQYV